MGVHGRREDFAAGGHLQWYDASTYLQEMIARIEAEPLVAVHLETELLETHGYKGNFTSVLKTPAGQVATQQGAIIVATGAREYRGPVIGYSSFVIYK